MQPASKPVIAGTTIYALAGSANRDFAECVVGYEAEIPNDLKTLLFDPQTAGGLLISIAPGDSLDFVQVMKAAGVSAVEIGELEHDSKPVIFVAA